MFRFLIIAFLLASCSQKIQVASTHSESSDTLLKDTLVSKKPVDINDQFNILSYCDSLNSLRKKDSTIKYIESYKVITEKGKIRIVVDSTGIAHLKAENDSLKFVFQTVKISHTVRDTIIVQTDCNSVKKQLRSTRLYLFGLIALILLLVGVYIGKKLFK